MVTNSEQRPPCPKCKRNVKNYFDHTQFDCKSMTDIQVEEEMLLRAEYWNYCNQFTRDDWKDGNVMSFDEWWRSQADNAKDNREGK